MSNNLYPLGYTEETLTADEISQTAAIGYRGGPTFDFSTGDFVRDGRNRIVECSGIESWKSWCTKAILTGRYNHLAYSFDYGVELDEALANSGKEEAESILAREITEALLADPYGRTQYVDTIDFSWNGPDSVAVSVTVRGIEDVTIDITAELNRGET